MSFQLRWLGVSCFEIVTEQDYTIIVDPYLTESVSFPHTADFIKKCDAILLSHGHYDHVLDVGSLTHRLAPRKIICNRTTAKSLQRHQGIDQSLLNVVELGDQIKTEMFTLDVIEGLHNNSKNEYRRIKGKPVPQKIIEQGNIETARFTFRGLSGTFWLPEKFEQWMTNYPAGEQLNFILTLNTGERIYIAGSYPDRSMISVAEKQAPVDLMLLQVMSGFKIKGLERQTVLFAKAAGSRVVIPHHHDELMKGATPTDLTKLKNLFAAENIPFSELVIGEWYEFSSATLQKSSQFRQEEETRQTND